MNGRWLGTIMLIALFGCDDAEGVDVLPLPPLERPTAEARLGLPEVQGIWRFAGWEILTGDSATLERTFPSFGDLRIDTQRLDSIAGSFQLGGGQSPIVGEVQRSGQIGLVTMAGGVPGRFLAGRFERDTLWLELASIMEPGEWPDAGRAAFVRGPMTEPIAWLRGAAPVAEPPIDPAVAQADTGVAPLPDAPGAAGGAQPPTSAPQAGQPQPGVRTQPGPAPAGPAVQPGPTPQPAPAGPSAQPRPTPQPQPAAPAQARPPTAAPPTQQPAPQPADPEPEPEAEPEPDMPPLLGDPVL